MFLFVVFAAVVYYVLPYFYKYAQLLVLKKKCADRRALALTYDGHLGANLTNSILDLLAREKVRATFFCTGKDVLDNPGILDRLLAEGHEIGCHSQRHLNAIKSWPWDSIIDISDCYRQLSGWVSSDATYRPPYGKLNILTLMFLLLKRIPIGLWTIDSQDTFHSLPVPGKIADKVIKEGGGVVLMHTLEGQSQRVEFVIETTRLLCETAKREKIIMCRLTELLKNKGKRYGSW